MPCISTIAPAGREKFLNRLLDIKKNIYTDGRFLLQFSLHSTDPGQRDRLIPVKKWDLAEISRYGDSFQGLGDRKITLNFAPAEDTIINAGTLLRYFDPSKYLLKITPINPTYQAVRRGLNSRIDPRRPERQGPLFNSLRQAGYEVIVSIGEVEENSIGSNCGQFLQAHLNAGVKMAQGYSYALQPVAPRV
jgi:23S rRNA (adenine2503-C2)-methyltransferase